jgi:hypothetical protein
LGDWVAAGGGGGGLLVAGDITADFGRAKKIFFHTPNKMFSPCQLDEAVTSLLDSSHHFCHNDGCMDGGNY